MKKRCAYGTHPVRISSRRSINSINIWWLALSSFVFFFLGCLFLRETALIIDAALHFTARRSRNSLLSVCVFCFSLLFFVRLSSFRNKLKQKELIFFNTNASAGRYSAQKLKPSLICFSFTSCSLLIGVFLWCTQSNKWINRRSTKYIYLFNYISCQAVGGLISNFVNLTSSDLRRVTCRCSCTHATGKHGASRHFKKGK